MAVTYKDWREMLSLLQYTFQQGQPPLLPSVHSMEAVLPVEVKVSSIGVMLNSKFELKFMTALYNYRLKQTSNKKVRPHDFKKPCAKKDIVFPTRL